MAFRRDAESGTGKTSLKSRDAGRIVPSHSGTLGTETHAGLGTC